MPENIGGDCTRCPCCLAEGAAGNSSFYFNARRVLWACCQRHHVRWYVTRELSLCRTEPDDTWMLAAYEEVECEGV